MCVVTENPDQHIVLLHKAEECAPEGAEELSSIGMDHRMVHHLSFKCLPLVLRGKRAIDEQIGYERRRVVSDVKQLTRSGTALSIPDSRCDDLSASCSMG